MKFGVREICDVVLKAKATQRVGNKIFYKNEPVIYFDTLKTSSLEGAATTVYAQGGRGNSRLIAWEGERTVTFTMEDALISPAGIAILSGADLFDADNVHENHKIKQHMIEQTDAVEVESTGLYGDSDYSVTHVSVYLKEKPYTAAGEDYIYIMVMNDGEVISEPYIPNEVATEPIEDEQSEFNGMYKVDIEINARELPGLSDLDYLEGADRQNNLEYFLSRGVVLADYYVERTTGAMQIDITPDKFGGNYYLEASTLFRDTNGVDLPAEFVIPNCKIQSNFTFTMANSGDPSTFTFTIDAFPDYTRFDKSKKVLAAIQIIDLEQSVGMQRRSHTAPTVKALTDGNVMREKTWTGFEPKE